MRINTKFFVLGATLVAGGLFAAAVGNLITFSSGEVIKSADVNSNFGTLKSAVAALEAPISTDRLADGAVSLPKIAIGGTAADGKVLKLQGGALAWSDDLLGTGGGTAYSAGSGLSLTGTTFSLANGGVTAEKLSATGGADGKVLKLQAGNLTWADDLLGSAGSTYSADGTSLQLTGTTFSVKDGGVGTGKLADGAVTAAKLAFPFSATGTFGFTGFFVNNTTASGGAIALAGRSGNAGAGLSITGPVGVLGESPSGIGVVGGSQSSIGVQGSSQTSIAVRGQGHSGAGLAISGAVGVLGESDTGIGVIGGAINSIGVLGRSAARGIVGTQGSLTLSCGGTYAVGGCAESTGTGVLGRSVGGFGVYGESTNNNAVYGVTAGANTNAAALASTSVSGYAAYFEAGNGAGGFATCTFHAGTTNWACSSDKNLKDNFKAVNPQAILEAVAQMPVTTWNMKGSKIRQLGPTAQDFYAAFKLGNSDKSINNTDAQGVALAAIKGLYQKNQALESENKTVKAKLEKLESQMADLQALAQEVANLKAQLKH